MSKEISYSDVQKKICDRLSKDNSLRKKLTSNPKEALSKELGIRFTTDCEIKIIDEDNPNQISLFLPVNPKWVAQQEFTEEQLDAIAGGQNIEIEGGDTDIYFTSPKVKITGDYTEIVDEKYNVIYKKKS